MRLGADRSLEERARSAPLSSAISKLHERVTSEVARVKADLTAVRDVLGTALAHDVIGTSPCASSALVLMHDSASAREFVDHPRLRLLASRYVQERTFRHLTELFDARVTDLDMAISFTATQIECADVGALEEAEAALPQ